MNFDSRLLVSLLLCDYHGVNRLVYAHVRMASSMIAFSLQKIGVDRIING